MIDHQIRELDILIRARYPIINVVSWEERRITDKLLELCASRGKKLYFWTQTLGLRPAGPHMGQFPLDPSTTDPANVLDLIRSSGEPAVYVLADFHTYLSPRYAQSAGICRKLRDLVSALHTTFKTVILLSPVLELPTELQKDITVVDYALPDLQELDGLLNQVIDSVCGNPEVNVALSPAEREQVLQATLGLTLTEAENVFAKSIVEKRALDVDIIVAEKEQIIRKSGILEYYRPDARLEHVGGLDLLKDWLRNRALAFSDRAREFGLPAPKGILLVGVQGCGKSLTAKAVASLWRMPLIRLDMGRVYAGLVGSSEENIRQAIRVSEAVSPCVLWLDEMEKALSGVGGSNIADAGVTARVFATLNTWLQEKTAPVFVVATANEIHDLPPELLRKGRFDEIFFVDLPAASERREIFSIHLARRNRDPKNYDLDALAKQSEGFSGAEIEQAVISALYRAFEAGRDLKTEDVGGSLTETVPLCVTMQEQIEDIRSWARTRARAASAHSLEVVIPPRRER